jgi:aerobic carbon-monoxide dehydrogenase large subunit
VPVLGIDLRPRLVHGHLGLEDEPVEVEDDCLEVHHCLPLYPMPGSILGSAVRRREDPRLVTGAGRYVDDVPVVGCLHMAFVRSPYAHATLDAVDPSAAVNAPGVVAVYSAQDLGLRPRLANGFIDEALARPPLAEGRVRFVGDLVAAVVADTRAHAADAALLVEVDYGPLPVVATPEAAAAEGAPLLFPDHGSNVAFTVGSSADGDVLAGAEVVVRQRMTNQRLAPVPLETNAVLAIPEADRLTVYCSTQSPFQVRDAIADALGMNEADVRCIAPDVGGGFGAKIAVYPEQVVVAAAARRIGRPVKYIETRSENLLAMNQGRAQVQDVEIGACRDGTLVGLRVRVISDAGAYPEQGAILPMLTAQMASGVYRFPAIDFESTSYATNTTPTAAYRGAGRPEAAALVERAMDLLAAELNIDPAALRRKNLIGSGEFPYTTPTGANYDSGDYARALDEALRMAGYDDLRAEQRRRREAADPRRLGVGLSCYVEVTAVGSPTEFAEAGVTPEGRFVVKVGTANHGQGHETAFAMVAADRLGVPMDQVDVVEGDTDRVARGDGTSGSRSLQLGGSAVVEACLALVERARDVAARLLEAAADDIEARDGGFGVVGVPGRVVSWIELAHAEPELKAEADFFGDQTYPFGAHVSVVEVDGDTGEVRLLRHIAVDDCGTIVNPKLAEGQVHGGIAQGVAQALFEEVIYDADANPRTASLLDYSVPTANELPRFETGHTSTPTPNNPLGAKGIGESGTIGSTPATWNAVIDALAADGVRHIEMPATPERVWRALHPNA